MDKLEEARLSLDKRLRDNFDKLKESSIYANTLRAEWLKEHPEYEEYEMQLDVEWQTCTDYVRGCLDGTI